MTSSSYMLERELLGSARAIIDANSNSSLVPPTQYSTYRSPYGTANGFGFTTAPTSADPFEPKKALADVKRFSQSFLV